MSTMFAAYLTALIGVMAAQASPGPNMMAVAGAGLAQGRRAALLVVAGIASGVLIWAASFAYGLGELFEAVPVSLTILKFVGGFYLLFLGIKALHAAFKGKPASIRANEERLSDVAAWRRGLLVILTNPKAALMWSAVATFLFGAGLTQWEVLGFGPLVSVTALLIYGAYGVLFSSRGAARVYERFTSAIEAVFGMAFGTLGAVLLGAGIQALRR